MHTVMGIMLGTIIIILLYNILVSAIEREKGYLYLSFYILSLILFLAAAPWEVWPETEVTAHLQLPQPEAVKLADPPDSEVQWARQGRLLL